jgi:hypothetical protein
MSLSRQYFYHFKDHQMFLRSNSSFHLLEQHKFSLLRICFDKFLLIQHQDWQASLNFSKEEGLYRLFNTKAGMNQLGQVKTFLLHQYPILSNNNCFPFSIKAILMQG